MDLAYRVVMFIKDIDPYGYLDSLGSDETDEDVIENYRELLKNRSPGGDDDKRYYR